MLPRLNPETGTQTGSLACAATNSMSSRRLYPTVFVTVLLQEKNRSSASISSINIKTVGRAVHCLRLICNHSGRPSPGH
jgi:hypothetical protein